MYKMATASVPSGTILAVHLQKCLHLSNEIRMMQKKYNFSIIEQLMPALKVNMFTLSAGINCILIDTWVVFYSTKMYILFYSIGTRRCENISKYNSPSFKF